MKQSYHKECLLCYECLPLPFLGGITVSSKMQHFLLKTNCKSLKLWLIESRHKVVMLKGFEGRWNLAKLNSINQIKERCAKLPLCQTDLSTCAQNAMSVQAIRNQCWRLCIASTLIPTAFPVICLQRRIVFWQTLTTWASDKNGLNWRYSQSSTRRHVRRTWSTWLSTLA